MNFRVAFVTLALAMAAARPPTMRGVGPNAEYFLGAQGEGCNEVCAYNGRVCNPHVDTNNSAALFEALGVDCKADPTPWWAPDQPSFVSDKSDKNYGKCLGFMDVPTSDPCDGAFKTTERLCRCSANTGGGAFGTGLSSACIYETETEIFSHAVSPPHVGVMTHFWATAGAGVLDDAIIRYYVDGEQEASIQFTPPMAAGVGFGDAQAPWGTKWFGKGAKDGAWYTNFRIPFSKSIRITAQRPSGFSGGFYMIVRGAADIPINVGGVNVPLTRNPRLRLVQFNQTVQPLEWVPVVNISAGPGVFFMSTLAVQSDNLNFLEGCYHLYSPYDLPFPGTVLSTGTEDYFDSAWYFNAGEFHLPVSGFTHLNQTGAKTGGVTWSAYRFHEMDPLPFDAGIQLTWRNGDMNDPVSGHKCYTEKGGVVVGSPSASLVQSYGWVYTWDE